VSQNNLGVALQKAGLDDAASHFAEATRAQACKAHANLANVRFAQGRYAETIWSYEAALNSTPAVTKRGGTWPRRTQPRELGVAGGASIRRCSNTAGDSLGARDASYHRALAAMVRKAIPDAVYAFEESLRLDPEKPTTHDALAIALFDLRDYQGAWREVQACRQRGGTPTASLVQALSLRMPEPK
jgi:tetratricopeptide (TPR) repeat protein